MQLLSLAQLFGEGAYQDANVLVIQKASLLRLTPNIRNTAESLLVGILITAITAFQGTLTDENNQVITDENNKPIIFDNSEAFELLKIFPWQPFQFTRNNQKYINNQIILNQYSLYAN